MEYRRRLIALHQDERGYSPQGKRGSGLVSIEVKGDTAFVSVTARDLIRPQNGTYIAVLFPCNAQTMPYVLGEIDYNERSMQLHKSIITSNMPYDIDDYRAAAIIFVGTHINFVLVGQSGCNLDWMRVKSNLRLKGPGCLIPQPLRRRGVSQSTISTYEPTEETASEANAAADEEVTVSDKSNSNKDMPLKDYGKVHFVDSSGTSSVGSVSASTPYVVSDFEKENTFEEVNAAKAEASEESSEEVFEAKGFDYSELTEEDEKVDAPLEVSLDEEDEDDVVASVHYDKGIEHVDIKAEESETAETSAKLVLEDDHELDHTELTDASEDDVKEENELKIRSKAEEIKRFRDNEPDTASSTKKYAEADQSEEASSSNVLSDEIEDARGFDYSELLGGAEEPVSADANIDDDVESEEAFDDESFDDEESEEAFDDESFDDEESEEAFDDEESLNEIETVISSSVKPTDEDIEKSFEEIKDTISEEASADEETSYRSAMSDEEYMKALDPYGGEPTEKTSATMHEDIDPCIYSQREVRKKMITCKKYGKRLPVRPFPAMTNSKWYKVEYPGMGSSFHYLIGSIHDGKGQEQVRCTAVPGPYGINPPAGLTGFTHYMTAQGMGNAGYWVSFVNPKTGRPVDVL